MEKCVYLRSTPSPSLSHPFSLVLSIYIYIASTRLFGQVILDPFQIRTQDFQLRFGLSVPHDARDARTTDTLLFAPLDPTLFLFLVLGNDDFYREHLLHAYNNNNNRENSSLCEISAACVYAPASVRRLWVKEELQQRGISGFNQSVRALVLQLNYS